MHFSCVREQFYHVHYHCCRSRYYECFLCTSLLIIVVAMVGAIVFDIFIDVGVIGVRREDLRVGGF